MHRVFVGYIEVITPLTAGSFWDSARANVYLYRYAKPPLVSWDGSCSEFNEEMPEHSLGCPPAYCSRKTWAELKRNGRGGVRLYPTHEALMANRNHRYTPFAVYFRSTIDEYWLSDSARNTVVSVPPSTPGECVGIDLVDTYDNSLLFNYGRNLTEGQPPPGYDELDRWIAERTHPASGLLKDLPQTPPDFEAMGVHVPVYAFEFWTL